MRRILDKTKIARVELHTMGFAKNHIDVLVTTSMDINASQQAERTHTVDDVEPTSDVELAKIKQSLTASLQQARSVHQELLGTIRT